MGILGLTEVITGAQLFVRGLATGFGILFASSEDGSQIEPALDVLGRGFGGILFVFSSIASFEFSRFLLNLLFSISFSFCMLSFMFSFRGLKLCLGIAAVTLGTKDFGRVDLVSSGFRDSSSCLNLHKGPL